MKQPAAEMQMPLRGGGRGGKPPQKRYKVCFIQAQLLQPQCLCLYPHPVKPPSNLLGSSKRSSILTGDHGPSLTEKTEATPDKSQDLLCPLKPTSPTLSPAPVPGAALATSPVGPRYLPSSGAWLSCGLLLQSPQTPPLLWPLPRHPGTS